MKQDLDLQQEQPLTTFGKAQGPKKRIVRLRCPAFTAEEWRAKNPLLQKGEFGVETDTHSVKVGDGVSRWLGLPYTSSTGASAWGNIAGDINNQLDLSAALDKKANSSEVQTMVDNAVAGITFEVFSVGKEGLVPAPTSSDASKCLLGNGKWGTPGDTLPSQSGQANKFLTTNGTTASWAPALTSSSIVTSISSSSTNTQVAGAKAVNDRVLTSQNALQTEINKKANTTDLDTAIAGVNGAIAGLQNQIDNISVDVDLTPYLTKTEAQSTYATTTYVNGLLGDIEAALATI